ncbi:MAG: glycine cleavage system aminomethyltransferase GcvT [Pseudomonadota bacterium]
MTDLLKTALFELHTSHGARLVDFAGYAMPVSFSGIISEHQHCRAAAGLFDVSHMGQLSITGADVAAALETVMPGDFQSLEPGQMRYSLLLNDQGGIIDDLMVTRRDDDFLLVLNASRKAVDLSYLKDRIGDRVSLTPQFDRALIALQGPKAVDVLSAFSPAVSDLRFMTAAWVSIDGVDAFVSRSGYTGEDGFEIALSADDAAKVAEQLLADERVLPVGLGARDTLRLEAGLPLYGNDLNEETTPVVAGLTWAVAKRRRAEANFPGAAKILEEIADGSATKRVGITIDGRQPVRAGAKILAADGTEIGEITSGATAPSLGGVIAMGYVTREHMTRGGEVTLVQRGKHHQGQVTKMPFITPGYVR